MCGLDRNNGVFFFYKEGGVGDSKHTVSSPGSSHHRPPSISSPPFITWRASSMVSAKRRSWPAMKEPLCGSPVQVLMSMMSRDWFRRVRSVESCGRGRGFWRWRG